MTFRTSCTNVMKALRVTLQDLLFLNCLKIVTDTNERLQTRGKKGTIKNKRKFPITM